MSTKNSPSTGSSFEQAGRKKTNLPVLVVIFLGLHAVVLGGVLWVGCKPHKPVADEAPPPSVLPPIGVADTNAFFPPIAPSTPQTGGIESSSIPPIQQIPPVTRESAPLPPMARDVDAVPVMPAPIPAPMPPPNRTAIAPPSVGPAAPIAPASAPATVAKPASVHVVGRGDTYYSISRDHHVSMTALKAANPGVDPRKLQLGQKIKVPAGAPAPAGSPAAHDESAYIVKSGDFLGRIAAKYGTTVARIREVNGLDSDRIRVGQRLKIPPKSGR